jgi:hypothetical protein
MTLAPVLSVFIAGAIAFSGCGGGDDGAQEPEPAKATAPKALRAAGFPKPSNRSMREVLRNMRQGPVLASTVTVLEPGTNRFGFGLFDRGNRQIGDIKVGLYYSRGLDETAHGPVGVRWERLGVEPKFRSRQTVDDPDAARSVYVSDLDLMKPGGYLISAVAELGNSLVATSPTQVTVIKDSRVPGVGDRAIRVHTPTRESVGGNIKSIETRVPPGTMNEADLADSLDKNRPVLLLFSTPAFCKSRVCGPVTDIAEQVKAEYGDRMDFIHMEIYKDNDPSKGPRPQFVAWHLPGEPFAFAIDSKGVIAERLEGAFSAAELTAAVRKALR